MFAVAWGAVPDYLIVVSIGAGVLSLILQRHWDADRDARERDRQARLADLRQAWDAIAPLVARPGGFDANELAQPFAAALRQLQLSGSEPVLRAVDGVTTTLINQGQNGEGMAVDLQPLIEAVRNDYRQLLDVAPTNRRFEPFAIVPREMADQWRHASKTPQTIEIPQLPRETTRVAEAPVGGNPSDAADRLGFSIRAVVPITISARR